MALTYQRSPQPSKSFGLFCALLVLCLNGPVLAQPPEQPEGLQAIGEPSSILLTWMPVRNPGIAEYRLYRGINGGFDPSTATPYAEGVHPFHPYFRDENISIGVPYFYAITAVNDQGQEGFPSELVQGVAGPRLEVLTTPDFLALQPNDCAPVEVLVVPLLPDGFDGNVTLSVSTFPDTGEVLTFFAGETRTQHPVLHLPGASTGEGSAAHARLMVCTAPNARDLRYTLTISAQGRLRSPAVPGGIALTASTTLPLQIRIPQPGEATVTLEGSVSTGARRHLSVTGSVRPAPMGPAETIDLTLTDPLRHSQTFTLPLDRSGVFSANFPAPSSGHWEMYASLNGARSDVVAVEVPRLTPFLKLWSSIRPGDTSGTFSGQIFPRDIPFMMNRGWLSLRFEADGPAAQRHSSTHPVIFQNGEFQEAVDFRAEFPGINTPGYWYVFAFWPGDPQFEPASSRVLRIPYLQTGDIRPTALIVADGRAATTGERATLELLGSRAKRMLQTRGFSELEITYLTSKPNEAGNDGLPDLNTIFRALGSNCGRHGSGPFFITIMAPVSGSEGSRAYQLGNNQTLTASMLRNALSGCAHPVVLFLDGDNTAHWVAGLSAGSAGEPGSRTVFSLAGSGLAWHLFGGELSVLNFLFTSLGQGNSLAEASLAFQSLENELPERFSLDARFDANGDGIHNTPDDLRALGEITVGLTWSDVDLQPSITSLSQETVAQQQHSGPPPHPAPEPKFAPQVGSGSATVKNTTALQTEKVIYQPKLQTKGSGGEGIWIRSYDPEFHDGGQIQPLPPRLLLASVAPTGGITEVTGIGLDADDTEQYTYAIPTDQLSQTGEYLVVTAVVDDAGNLSNIASTSFVLENQKPQILAAGWENTNLTSQAGGTLRFGAILYDPNGINDLISLRFSDGTQFSDVPASGLEVTPLSVVGEGIALVRIPETAVAGGLPSGQYAPILLQAEDSAGNRSDVWPNYHFPGECGNTAARYQADQFEAVFTLVAQWQRTIPGSGAWWEEYQAAITRPAAGDSPVNIWYGGAWETNASACGGGLEIFAYAPDAGNLGVKLLEVLYEGASTGVMLQSVNSGITLVDEHPNLGFFGLHTVITSPISLGEVQLQLRAVDSEGNLSAIWPYLMVR